jgi:hypothetical protein
MEISCILAHGWEKKIVTVASNHIEAGIKKYGGQVDAHLASLIKSAGLTYTPYLFTDGRILLVLPNNISAILYPDNETFFEQLDLG